MANYIIRNMSPSEVSEIALKWAAEEGWNPGLYDSESFLAADNKGFLVGLLDDKPVSCISAVSYGNSFGFIGFYIVKEEYRGKGYGIKIWDRAMAALKGCNIGLDGVVQQQENYKKSGFKFAYGNIRFEFVSKTVTDDFSNVLSVADLPFDRLVEYDSKRFFLPRPAFLKEWIKQPGSYSYVVMESGELKGYGMIRECQNRTYKIGPLFADSYDSAHKLFARLSSSIPPGRKVYFDIPEVNPKALKIVSQYKMNKVFETARMYTGNKPEIDLSKVFGITTFELG